MEFTVSHSFDGTLSVGILLSLCHGRLYRNPKHIAIRNHIGARA